MYQRQTSVAARTIPKGAAAICCACPWPRTETCQGAQGVVELQAWNMFIKGKEMWPEKRPSQRPKVGRALTVPEDGDRPTKEKWRERKAGD